MEHDPQWLLLQGILSGGVHRNHRHGPQQISFVDKAPRWIQFAKSARELHLDTTPKDDTLRRNTGRETHAQTMDLWKCSVGVFRPSSWHLVDLSWFEVFNLFSILPAEGASPTTLRTQPGRRKTPGAFTAKRAASASRALDAGMVAKALLFTTSHMKSGWRKPVFSKKRPLNREVVGST